MLRLSDWGMIGPRVGGKSSANLPEVPDSDQRSSPPHAP